MADLRCAPRLRAKFVRKITVIQHPDDAVRQFPVAAARKEQSFFPVVYEIRHTSYSGRHYRHAEQHCLAQRVRRILHDGRTDKNIRRKKTILHLPGRQGPGHEDMSFKVQFMNQVEKVFSVGAYAECKRHFVRLRVKASVIADDRISRAEDLCVRILFKYARHRQEQIMKSLERIIALAQENAVCLAVLRIPPAAVEAGAHRLVHRMIECIRIDGIRLTAVEHRAARDVTGSENRESLIPGAHLIFMLLCFDGIAADTVPERLPAADTVGKVCHIGVGNCPAQSLNSYERTLRAAKGSRHQQRMRELRSEDMHNIRSEIIQDFRKSRLKPGIIDFRMREVFLKSVEHNAPDFLPAVSEGLRNRAADTKLDIAGFLSERITVDFCIDIRKNRRKVRRHINADVTGIIHGRIRSAVSRRAFAVL